MYSHSCGKRKEEEGLPTSSSTVPPASTDLVLPAWELNTAVILKAPRELTSEPRWASSSDYETLNPRPAIILLHTQWELVRGCAPRMQRLSREMVSKCLSLIKCPVGKGPGRLWSMFLPNSHFFRLRDANSHLRWHLRSPALFLFPFILLSL